MLSTKEKIKSLEYKIKALENENDKLRKQLDLKLVRGECKSEFCYCCTHFMGVFNGVLACEKYDDAPCNEFEFNTFPIPQAEPHMTELTAEYLMNSVKNCNNRQN